MTDWLRPLLLMFYAPVRAMAEVRERAPLGQAALLAFVAQAAYTLFVFWPYLPRAGEVAAVGVGSLALVLWKAVGALLFSAIIFVPVVIFVSNVSERRASFGLTLQQEYAAVASAVFYARALSCLLALPCFWLIRASGVEEQYYPQSAVILEGWLRESGKTLDQLLAAQPLLLQEGLAATIVLPFFVVWLVIAVREAFRISWLRAGLVALGSGLLTFPLMTLFGRVFEWVAASPFLLIVLFLLMRGYIGEVMRGQRARAAFRQNLEAATLNPADASAHYNLGLLHLRRKELGEARARFERAVEIDPDEVDAHYQLGRVARAEGRLAEAIGHFEQVVVRAPAHAQNELWREIGATYLAAGQFADAKEVLGRFLDQRSSDPEGLYLMGRAHFGLGNLQEAKEWMQRCIEAVKTSPAYKYRAEKRWLNEAQQFLRSQA